MERMVDETIETARDDSANYRFEWRARGHTSRNGVAAARSEGRPLKNPEMPIQIS
jgi:hypothetical protein